MAGQILAQDLLNDDGSGHPGVDGAVIRIGPPRAESEPEALTSRQSS